MFALFSRYESDDYTPIKELICVSVSEEKLENEITRLKARHERLIAWRAAYRDQMGSLPIFTEPAPVKARAGFVPRTKEEHETCRKQAQLHQSAHQLWLNRMMDFEQLRERRAIAMVKQAFGSEDWPEDERLITSYYGTEVLDDLVIEPVRVL